MSPADDRPFLERLRRRHTVESLASLTDPEEEGGTLDMIVLGLGEVWTGTLAEAIVAVDNASVTCAADDYDDLGEVLCWFRDAAGVEDDLDVEYVLVAGDPAAITNAVREHRRQAARHVAQAERLQGLLSESVGGAR